MGEQPQMEAPTQKRKLSVYTVMLVISFFCLVTACVLLYQELTLWGNFPWWNTTEGKPNVSVSLVLPGDISQQSHLA